MTGRRGDDRSAPSRRTLLKGAAVLGAAGVIGMPPSVARAGESFKSFAFGTYEIMVASDGHLMLPNNMGATNVAEDVLKAALGPGLELGAMSERPTNITLIRAGEELIMIDAGAGPNFMATAGRLADNLQAAGINLEDVTKIIFTHGHPDHLWGTIDEFDDSPRFPNASYFVAEDEWNLWMSEDAASKLPEARANFVPGARRNLNGIKDLVTTFKPGQEVIAGIQAIDTAGHTQGHVSLAMSAGGEELVVLGDALTHEAISFAHPEWTPVSDHEPQRAVETRKRLLDRLATNKSRVIGFHLPFPGVGRVEREGGAYRYVGDA